MKKAFFRYLFSFAMLTLCMVSQLCANIDSRDAASITCEESVSDPDYLKPEISAIPATLSTTHSGKSSSKQFETSDFELEEEDDEQFHKSKISADLGAYFALICSALILGYFQKNRKKRSPSSEQSYHFAFCEWFKLFQVFRI